MNYDIRNMNIWKEKPEQGPSKEAQLNCDLSELNLSQRSFNCLRRAGCNTIGDILKLIENDENGLRKIRNLGARSEEDILEKLREYKSQVKTQPKTTQTRAVSSLPVKKRKDVYTDKDIWDSSIEEFHLSDYALSGLRKYGIKLVKDIYATDPKNEPGWYAVRELLEKIPT